MLHIYISVLVGRCQGRQPFWWINYQSGTGNISFTFHNILGTLWARFVGHFEKYLYLFLQSSHFVRSIRLAEVEHKISQ